MIASTQTNHPLAAFGQVTSSQSALEGACSRLRNAGLRVTQPRIAILTVLIGKTAPVSIEQLHAELTNASCDLVTVYRCLAAFQEVGLVRLSYFHNGTSLYQLCLEGTQAPYHIVSKETNAVTELDESLSSELRQVLSRVEAELKNRGYTGVSHSLSFFATKGSTASISTAFHDRTQEVVSMPN